MQKIPQWRYSLLVFLCLFTQPVFAMEQFVSLTLCSDRLLIELARPEQISAMSPYSKNPFMMLDKLNTSKPTVEPQLTQLLPYLDKTFLINENFYPHLAKELKQLGAKIIPIDESPQTTEQLFARILHLGTLLENKEYAEQWVASLRTQNFPLNAKLTETLLLSDTGIVEPQFPQYQALLNLLGLTPLKTDLTPQNFSLEKLLLAQPNWLIYLTDQQGYNEQAELLNHPLLQRMFYKQPQASIPMKFTYCFDHGIWQGAKKLYLQLTLK